MPDDTRVLPFAKPGKKARLEQPDPDQRRQLADGVLSIVGHIESDPTVVGYAVVLLCDDGQRIDGWGCHTHVLPQLARVSRKMSASIARDAMRKHEEGL